MEKKCKTIYYTVKLFILYYEGSVVKTVAFECKLDQAAQVLLICQLEEYLLIRANNLELN